MTVTRDFNVGTVFSIVAFLLVQTAAGAYWGGRIHNEVRNVKDAVQVDQKEQSRTDQRQWDRLKELTQLQQSQGAVQMTFGVKIETIAEDVREVRQATRSIDNRLRSVLENGRTIAPRSTP